MIEMHRVAAENLCPVEEFDDHYICQTQAWLNFVQETQGAEPIFAELREHGKVVGQFRGLMLRKFGLLRMLGSPLPGWTTAYMGFNLRPGVERRKALAALPEFAFGKLGCAHLEVMDRALTPADYDALGFRYRFVSGFEIDLQRSEDEIFNEMNSACRRCIRKAEKSGVILEAASDEAFVDDFYNQLQDVFAKQKLVPTYKRERVAALIKHLLPTGNLLLVRARDPEGNCIATGIFPGINQMMYFWGGASWRADQNLRPNEALQWFAIRYWKERGISSYDMGGAGEYKRKYGGREIAVPWGRVSRYPLLETMRNTARSLVDLKQRLWGANRS